MPTRAAVVLSYRLGGTDGVSVEADKWIYGLAQLGFVVRRVAGYFGSEQLPNDVEVPWLARYQAPDLAADESTLLNILADVDLVVVENVCSLPVNVEVTRRVIRVLSAFRGRVLLHHHDLPWQRTGYEIVSGIPPVIPSALHVTINDLSRQQLAQRGISAITVRNAFDFSQPGGRRHSTRVSRGFDDSEVVLLQPTRAIARKGVPTGIRFAEDIQHLMPDRPVAYWITGPAEDGYDAVLSATLKRSCVRTIEGRIRHVRDAYAAADAIILPSSWEGFGNPVIESILARRPLAVRSYPVLSEIVQAGLQFFDVENPSLLASFLRHPDDQMLERNYSRAKRDFSLADLPAKISAAFAWAGWSELGMT